SGCRAFAFARAADLSVDCVASHSTRVRGRCRSLRSFAQTGLCGAGKAWPGDVASTAPVHLSGAAPGTRLAERVQRMQPPRTNACRAKTPCFMRVFECTAPGARATTRVAWASGRRVTRECRADRPDAGAKNPRGGVDS